MERSKLPASQHTFPFLMHFKSLYFNDIQDLHTEESLEELAASLPNIPFSEWLALKDFYDSTDGKNWHWRGDNSYPWDFSSYALNNPCRDMWAGINCGCNHFPRETSKYYYYYMAISVSNCNVEKLTLVNYNLVGTLSSSIGKLTYLNRLFLGNNHIHGTIPKELALLSNMTKLGLSNNHLTGTISSSFAQMINLETLYLHYNDLTGSIPSSLYQMSKLRYLKLSFNSLTGPIPSSFGQMTNLKALSLSSNNLIGTIPPSLGTLSNLNFLSLDVNHLTGTIPSSLGGMNNLLQIWLHTNHLTGTIPSNIGNFSLTQYIGLGETNINSALDNQFIGSIPISYCNYENILFIPMPSSNKTCFPTCLYNKLNLNYLKATVHCPGDEDVALCDMVKSTNMNKIVSDVKNSVSQIISSPHPVSIGFHSSQTISVADAVYYTISFTGNCDLPLEDVVNICLDDFTCPWVLTCTSASLTITESSFIMKFEQKSASNIYYGYEILIVAMTSYIGWQCEPFGDSLLNNYAPDYCTWTGVLCLQGSVNQISLSGFGITGSLPSTISLLTNMQVLNLKYNSIRETIPSTISALSLLNTLDLSNNKFKGTIPQQMDLLTQLTAVNLASNRLTGTIPTSITSLKYLETFYVSDNTLSGQITYPLCVLSANVSLQVTGNADIGCYQYCGSSSNSLQSQLPICSPTQSPTASPVSTTQNNSIIITVCSVGVALILLFLIYYRFVRRKYSKILFENAELARKRKQSLFVLPIHSFLLHANDLKASNATDNSFIQELNLLIEKHEDSISALDFDGRSVIDIVLMFYGDPFSDKVLLSVLRKW